MLATLRILAAMGGLQRLFPLWLAAIGVAIFNVSFWMVLALIYGVIIQFFVEYLMHRFVLHREPPEDQPTFNALYRSHIGHHGFPANPEFLTGDDHWYALRFGLISVTLHTAVLWPFVGLWPAFSWSFVALFAGSVSAFAFYEFCHTLARLNVPKGWFGRAVTRSHMMHHFHDHDATYHVTFGMGWIDRLFGTGYDADAAKARYDRDTVMSIGMDPEDVRLITARKAYGLPARPDRKSKGIAPAS